MKRYIGLEDMSHINCASVLRVIQSSGGISRKQISDITGLSWGGMTKIVNKLMEHEYIVEEKNGAFAGNGRTPGLLRVNTKKHLAAGADINHTGLRAWVTDFSGGLRKMYFRENHFGNREELLENILSFFEMIFQDDKNEEIQAVGIAMQGRVDSEKGISIHFPECENWRDVPLVSILKERFHTEIYLEHDPDCMLFFEMESMDAENVILLRIDQSIGMAVALGGAILRGTGILELPHSIVIPGGKPCKCGLRGCLEAYIAPCMQDGKIQRQALEEMVSPLAVAIYNSICMFHAEAVILTGDLMKYHGMFEDRLFLELQNMQKDTRTAIRFSEDTETAVKGAALIAARQAVNAIRL